MEKVSDKIVSFVPWDRIEEEARGQIENTAKLPFLFKHVAVMPDCHYGKGATVGTVLPTEGAVVPAAVGVDIGCFAGDVKVSLLDGTQATFKELVERGDESFWVYSCNSKGDVVPGKAVAKKTRKRADLVRVVVSGGDEIVCTPDHQFLMKDGSYVEAKDLKFNDSVMPLYRTWHSRDGYEKSSTGKGNAKLTHKMVYEHLNGAVSDGYVIHHVNHNHFDNRPENLCLMDKREHSKYHRLVGHRFDNSDPEFQKKRIAGMRDSMKDSAKRAKKERVGTENITSYMREHYGHFKESIADNGKCGAKYLVRANVSEKKCSECGHVSKNMGTHRWHKKRQHQSVVGDNHKVVSVEKLEYKEDVYCLQVEEYHNFALASGVFVHNCGMIAVRTNLKRGDLPDLKGIREGIERRIPMTAGHNNKKITDSAELRIRALDMLSVIDYKAFDKSWKHALGTLGGGNHFVELCVDEHDTVWATLHSGSRGVGNKIGNYYISVAKDLMKRFHVELPDEDLAFLPEGTFEFSDYLRDLHWAQEFARHNRDEMMDRVMTELSYAIYGEDGHQNELEVERVNCHHNFTQREEHMGKNVWVTRKGAICAREGDRGMIPGSMGTRSYIITGKGNVPSFQSSPHGAGRRMSRGKAREQFDVEQLDAAMEGVEYRRSDKIVDEIPGAYKDIDEVMEYAKELVDIDYTLKQVLNCKGD